MKQEISIVGSENKENIKEIDIQRIENLLDAIKNDRPYFIFSAHYISKDNVEHGIATSNGNQTFLKASIAHNIIAIKEGLKLKEENREHKE